MTAIEFYDRTPTDNIISSITTVPDKIIFIGESKNLKNVSSVIGNFIGKRNPETQVLFRNIKRNSITNIVEVLSDIIETEEECVFDLTGGEDLVLVAMGIVAERYKDRNIQMQRFNINNNVVTDCDNDGRIIYDGTPNLTAEDNITLNGGTLRYENDGMQGTYRWDITEDFASDVKKAWEICRSNPGYWNKRIGILEEIEEFSCNKNSLEVQVNIEQLKMQVVSAKKEYVNIDGLLVSLYKNKFIENYTNDGVTIRYTYKNSQVKRFLIKEGLLLELRVFIAGIEVKNKDGNAVYNDAINGAFIDWDGVLHTKSDEEKDTENEIDVILMHGLIPLFISCKNGKIEEEELYKLSTVTNRFGGIYAKKVLIATYLNKKNVISKASIEHLRQRASDMGIKLIENVHKLDGEQFDKMVKHLVNA